MEGGCGKTLNIYMGPKTYRNPLARYKLYNKHKGETRVTSLRVALPEAPSV